MLSRAVAAALALSVSWFASGCAAVSFVATPVVGSFAAGVVLFFVSGLIVLCAAFSAACEAACRMFSGGCVCAACVAACSMASALFIVLRVLYSETMSCISLIRAGSGLVLFRTSSNSFAYAPMRERDLRGSLASSGVKYLSWALDGSKCSATAVLLALFMPDAISGALSNPAVSAPIIAEYRASSLSRSISLFSPAAIFLNTGSKTDCRYSSVASLPMSAT